jgi:hypothetical protein
MAGFQKAAPQQAAVKMSMYGPPGSGKTFSALLFAEGISRAIGKRIAFVDTERGTDFYAQAVPNRDPHPEAFDFDAIYTRSIAEVNQAVRSLTEAHGIIVIDSVSHLWDTAINSYAGPKTGAGTIPMWAWSKIKGPYKELMRFLVDSPFHVFILGRQSNVFEEDSQTGETKAAGVKMRAEGETAYEPHICLRMIPERTTKQGKKTVIHREQIITALAEKDRTGVLAGQMFQWPNYELVIAPLMGLLGKVQGETPSDDEAAAQDAEANAAKEKALAKAKADAENVGKPDPISVSAELKAKTLTLLTAAARQGIAALQDAWQPLENPLKAALVSEKNQLKEIAANASNPA